MSVKSSDSSVDLVHSGNSDTKSSFTSASSYSICFSSLQILFCLHTSARCFCRCALCSSRVSPSSVSSDVLSVSPPSSSSIVGWFSVLTFAAHFMVLTSIIPTKAIVCPLFHCAHSWAGNFIACIDCLFHGLFLASKSWLAR